MDMKEKLQTAALLACTGLLYPAGAAAQTYRWYTTTEGEAWKEARLELRESTPGREPLLRVAGGEEGTEFKAWGTCFNELDWDALNLLGREAQEEVMANLFAPGGDLRFTRGRISMNANDYARDWYSCDEVAGDFQLRHFNIERDKRGIIPLIRAAQRYNPGLTFWMSPWSPPTWMKINNDYPVLSSPYNRQDPRKDYLLYDAVGEVDADEVKIAGQRPGKFPGRLAANDYMIQDPRYLQAYADMFCRFIELYREQGVPIDMVMYQNEAYSYTPYPGCAWTAEGTIRFNRDYLAPTLKARLPGVKLYLGTFNTNRLDYVQKIIDGLEGCGIEGLGFQWEGRENLVDIRRGYPDLKLVSSESECGNGSMDWAAGEHTFHLLADYVGKGCEEYFIWNFILADDGESPWGWKQNALIQVDSKTRRHRYTAEYYAVKHFSHLVPPGSRMLAYKPKEEGGGTMPIVVFRTPEGKYVVVAGNFASTPDTLRVELGGRCLEAELPPHSFHTFAGE